MRASRKNVKKRERKWKKWAGKQREEPKRGHKKAHVKGRIFSEEQREEERQRAPEDRLKKLNNNVAEKGEQVSRVLYSL